MCEKYARWFQAAQSSSPVAVIHPRGDCEKIILLFCSVHGLKNNGNNLTGFRRALNVIMYPKCFARCLAQSNTQYMLATAFRDQKNYCQIFATVCRILQQDPG